MRRTNVSLSMYKGGVFLILELLMCYFVIKAQIKRRKSNKVQVGNDQGKVQSEKDSHSKNRGGKKLN